MPEATTPSAECAVLFADLVGSTQLYERVGDKIAFELIDRCIRDMRIAVETKGGRVVKHTGDGLMAVFRDADSAADATLVIHQTVKDIPSSPEQRLAVRIGFHFGPVVASGTDVFGETVNFAARLAELASPGKAITGSETARRLGPEWRSVLHQLPARVVRGLSKPVEVCELMCEAAGELTIVQSDHFLLEAAGLAAAPGPPPSRGGRARPVGRGPRSRARRGASRSARRTRCRRFRRAA